MTLIYSVNRARQPGTDFIELLRRRKLIVPKLLEDFNFYKARPTKRPDLTGTVAV